MPLNDESKLAQDFIDGKRARWHEVVSRLSPKLAAVAEEHAWPVDGAQILASFYLNLSIRDRAIHVLRPVASGDQDLESVLITDFSAFTIDLENGRKMAADIMSGNRNALEFMIAAYSCRLVAWLRAKDRNLDADELTQEFLHKKILCSPEKMLRPVADGKKVLWRRLCRSLSNFVDDRRRGRRPPVQIPLNADGEPIDVSDPRSLDRLDESSRADQLDEIRARIHEALNAIRMVEWQPAIGRAAHRQALLLHERAFLLYWTRRSYADLREEERSVDEIDLVSRLMPWTAEEQSALIGSHSLQSAWKKLAQQVMEASCWLTTAEFGLTLGVGENTWGKWLSRGRTAVRKAVGPDRAWYLFRHWRA